MNAFEQVLDVLAATTGFTPKGNERTRSARCPAHDDHTPSLSITRGTDRVLIKCQAGCDTDDVIAALGMTRGDLYDEPRTSNGSGPATVEYPYTDEDGKVLFVVQRREPKSFRQYRILNGAKVWNLNDVRRVLYRLPAVIAAVRDGRTVYVVEGEKDVHALERAGQVATCNPGGAGKWRDEYAEVLAGAPVYIIADKDEPGRAHATQVAASLAAVAASVQVVEPAVGKDVSDHLAAGKTLAELVAADGGPVVDSEPVGRFLDWSEFWATDRAEAEWLVEPLVAVGQAISTYSPPKVGKSLLWLEIATALAAGRPVLGNPAREPMHVVYIDHEQTTDDLDERLTSLGYGPGDDLSRLHYSLLADWPPLDSAEGGQALHAAATGFAARLVVLDTISRAIKGKENDSDTWLDLYRHTVRRLKRDRIAFVRLDHSGKDITKGQRGSSAKSADVDTVWQLLARGSDTLTLKRESSRSGYGPPMFWLRRELDPLRHVIDSADEAHERDVERIIDQLDELDVPVDAGRPTASEALRGVGIKVRNARLSEAMKRRRLRADDDAAEDLSPTLFDSGTAVPEPISAATGTTVPNLSHAVPTLSPAVPRVSQANCPRPPLSNRADWGQVDTEADCATCGWPVDTIGHEMQCGQGGAG